MKKGIVLSLIGVILFCGCGPDDGNSGNDVNSGSGVATANYIDLSCIDRISRFRSGTGHSDADGSESCRSMKHYFVPRSYPVRVFSPVDGSVDYFREESTGTEIGIKSGARTFIIFHVSISPPLKIGDRVIAGQQIGTHIGTQTWSDIAVEENNNGGLCENTPGCKRISYFTVMDDKVFSEYQARGVASRNTMIITKEERDSQPLQCDGNRNFMDEGSIQNWIQLK